MLRVIGLSGQTDVGTVPLGASALVVVAIGAHAVAVHAQRVPLLVIATSALNLEVIIGLCGADVDHAQGPGIPDRVQATLVAQSRIGQYFTDLEIGEAGQQVCEASGKDAAFVDVGRMHIGADGPGTSEAVIEDAVWVRSIAIEVLTVACLPFLFPSCNREVSFLG